MLSPQTEQICLVIYPWAAPPTPAPLCLRLGYTIAIGVDSIFSAGAALGDLFSHRPQYTR